LLKPGLRIPAGRDIPIIIILAWQANKEEEEKMDVLNWKDCQNIKLDKYPYKGKDYDLKGVSVRWLSKYGEDDMGRPEYGLRFFTVEPGGEIPIHNHFFQQTMYILSGQFECWSYDLETDELVEKRVCGPGDAIYLGSMEPHGMKNLSDTEPATFICCVCSVYGEDED
jgi:quercetin dioxygenase-like cupin family protein